MFGIYIGHSNREEFFLRILFFILPNGSEIRASNMNLDWRIKILEHDEGNYWKNLPSNKKSNI